MKKERYGRMLCGASKSNDLNTLSRTTLTKLDAVNGMNHKYFKHSFLPPKHTPGIYILTCRAM